MIIPKGLNYFSISYQREKTVRMKLEEAQPNEYIGQNSMSGEISNEKWKYFKGKTLNHRTEVGADVGDIDAKGNFILNWKPAENKTTYYSAYKEESFLPEFEAILPIKSGVYTLENIDHKDDASSSDGLSAGAIAGIVIACILIVVIIAVCI